MDTKELIKTRKSVRTFDRRPLASEDLAKLEAFAATIENPFGNPVEFVFLDAAEHKLSSKVIQGESYYVAGKVEKAPHCEEAFGFAFEKLVLYAWSLGIGTTWIAGTLNRPHFEQEAHVGSEERMFAVSPLGYPAAKKSLVEAALRRGVKGDDRLPSAELFFDGDFSTPLATDDQSIIDALEAVRWAPSAANKQPSRVVKTGNDYHFFVKHNKGYASEPHGDLQKVDLGIALCHFQEMLGGTVSFEDPGIASAPDTEFLFTVSV